MSAAGRVCLTSRWFLKPGCLDKVLAAIRSEMVPRIEAGEPETLTYLVHRPLATGDGLQSLPPTDAALLLFYEEYASPAAFEAHVTGPIFTGFVADYGDCFIQAGGKPYTTVTFLSRESGFVRWDPVGASPDAGAANRHPAVMFEVLSPDPARARAFYSAVFGWAYAPGSGPHPFHYVHFPAGSPPLLGGIGSANPGVPGFAAGTNFYLLVDDAAALGATLKAAEAHGAAILMPPTIADGYHFAMFTDPDGFAIGLIARFAD